jgi:hypothetical protein
MRALYFSAVTSRHERRRSRTSQSFLFDLAPCSFCTRPAAYHFFPIFIRREEILNFLRGCG